MKNNFSIFKNLNIIPTVFEKTIKGEYSFDLYSRLLRERILFVSGEINDDNTNLIIAQLLYLEGDDSYSDIYLYINSIGGSVTNGLAIYDTMNYIKPDVCTFCIGTAYSMGAFLLAAGKKGKRFSLSNSRIMIHQPLGGSQGQASDIEINAKEIILLKKKLVKLFSLSTRQENKKNYKRYR